MDLTVNRIQCDLRWLDSVVEEALASSSVHKQRISETMVAQNRRESHELLFSLLFSLF